MTKVTGSVKDFQSAIRKFQKADSASAHKLTKAEVSTALEILQKNGVSAPEKAAAKDVLSKAQLTKGAKELLENFVADAGSTRPEGPIKLKPETRAKMTEVFQKANLAGTIPWRDQHSVPAGLALRREPLFAERHPDGFSYVALIPNGSVDPRHMGAKDPNKATYFFVERSGGFAGLTQVAGPFQMADLNTGKTAKDVKAMLQGNDELRWNVLRSAFPSYTRSAPPVMADVRKLDDGNFAVKVQLVHFRTREVQGEQEIKINADGKVLGKLEGGFETEAVSEIPGGGVTTMAVGEEGGGGGGGGGGASTEAVGEEGGGGGGGGRVTTLALGEEGGGGWRGGGAVTLAIPEN
ncbi:MAG: hypothetical protein AB2A00_27455 [Myxococcota bacterium]